MLKKKDNKYEDDNVDIKNKNSIKIISFNVNGIRAVIKKDFINSLKKLNGDIVCIQETKAHPEQVEHSIKELGYEYEYWNSAEKKGYSGTAIFSKIKPLSIEYGLGVEELDNEGRVITAEFNEFYLVNVYTPNSKRELERLNFRYEIWDREFLKFLKKLEKKKPVIFCGDLNAAHKPIDLKNDKANMTTKTKPGSAGFTDKEREGITNIINSGFIDTFRFFHPNEEKYTWWSYMFKSREKNIGWRIDYFFISESIKDKLISAEIHNEIHGSDHCPISIEVEF